MLRRRDSHAQYRPPRKERSAVYAVLLHGPFVSHAGEPDDGTVCPSGGYRRHVRGPRSRAQAGCSGSAETRRLPGVPEPELRDDGRGAEGCRLSYLHVGQVASGYARAGKMAFAARLRPFLRHPGRRYQLPSAARRPRADARQHQTDASGGAVLHHRCLHRLCH